MDSAYDWKQYYIAERARIGQAAMLALVEAAEPLELGGGAAIVIPHTRFEVTGPQIARAVSTVLESGADSVLALGVLHGARRVDQQEVVLARAGNVSALAALRGTHDEKGLAAEEFSLDAFTELLGLASARRGRSINIVRKYPFLVGDDPASLPGIEQLQERVDGGALVVATTDPMHHGHAYGTPDAECLDPSLPSTLATALQAIEEQMAALSEHRFGDFVGLAAQHSSDFRDTGPVLAHLLGQGFDWRVRELALVDYCTALQASSPSWVAGALVVTTSV